MSAQNETKEEKKIEQKNPYLISCDELADLLAKQQQKEYTGKLVKIIDASWFHPVLKRDTNREYLDCHIPGAVRFDIDKICDSSIPLPHMLPKPEMFIQAVSDMGISNNDHIVIYDGTGVFSGTTRVWWTFMVFGADEHLLSILHGGFSEWKSKKLPVESGEVTITKKGSWSVTNGYRLSWVRSFEQMIEIVRSPVEKRMDKILIDARPPGRYKGVDPEPRPCANRGHLPTAINIPFTTLCTQSEKGQYFLSVEDMKKLFDRHRVDMNENTVLYCGSGVTASTVLFSLYALGHRKLALYDGSFAEWGNSALTKDLLVLEQ